MKLSERDLKLLLIVLTVVALFGAWWGAGKIKEQNTLLETENKQLEYKYAELKIMDENRKKYENDITKYATIYTNILQKYGNGLDQEHIIMLLKAGEDNTGIWLKTASLAGVGNIYTFGDVTSTNPSRTGEKVYNSDYIGVNSVLTVTFEGTYAQVKDFISYINTHSNKHNINNISMTNNSGLITGTFQLETFGIVGSDREYKELELMSVGLGTENIFASETFVPEIIDGDYAQLIKANHDVFLMLHAEGTDVDSVAIGTSDDIDGSKTLSVNSNTTEKVTLRISGTEGKYKISYRIGNETYPEDNYADGVDFVCGETLDLLVVSSSRVDSKDKAGADLTIVNNSDLVLNYTVINEDEKDPRFEIEKVTGQIISY